MKHLTLILCLTVTAFVMGSCGENTTRPASQGTPYELIVLASHEKWDGPLGDTLRSILQEPVEFINQYEPQFDVRRILPNQFKDFIRRHRNIINLRTGADYPEPSMTALYDHFSVPQLIINLSGPDDATLTRYVSEHGRELRAVFNIAERDRYVALSRRAPEVTLERAIAGKFGFSISIPRSFTSRISDTDDFTWLSAEYPLSSQGVVIYSYPYTDRNDFTLDSLMDKRDRFVSRVNGPSDGSYMITVREFEPALRYLRIYNREWAEMRGFWDVYGDFMGGPFVSYSTRDAENNRIVCIDCYIYAPSHSGNATTKRNLIRQLESLIYTVSFPGDSHEPVPRMEPVRVEGDAPQTITEE